MATEDDSDVPESGAVFTFGKSRFADNIPNKFWIRNDKVVQISCGDEHTALVAESGRVFTFGSNDWGQLGLGNTKPQNKPSCIKSLKQEKIKLVTCGRSHTVVATESGKLYTCGANGEGQLGIGDSQTSNCPQPQYLESLEPLEFIMLAAGADHTLALTEDGDVYGWGANSEGQLGLKDETECPEPKHIVFDEAITCIACGYYHSAVITESGKLLTFGETDGGKLGLGDHVERHREPQMVSGIREKLKWVACGGSHTVAVAEGGKVYSFGDGNFGQLGHGTTLLQIPYPQQIASLKDTKITYSACGENHTALITERGQLITFGDGRHGKLGLGEENFANQFKPSKVPRFQKFIVAEVKCGGCHMLALASLKLENGDWSATDDEAEEEELQNHIQNKGLNALRHSEDMDLSGSFSARDRRRQKPDPSQTLTRTLPPLNSSFSAKALPPLSSTLPAHEKKNPLNRGKLPEIIQDEVDGEVENPKTKTPKDREEDSDVSLTPEGESDDSENEMEKKRAEIKKQAAKAGPQPKPRSLPRIQVQKPNMSSPRDLESEESGEESEEETKPAKPVKAVRAAPLKAIPSKSPRKSKDKKEESEEEEEESEEEEKKKDVKKKKGRRKGKDEESEEEDEEEEKDKKKGDKKKKGKGKKAEAESEESEEEDRKKGKDKKKDKKEKDKKKKKGGIFGRKRADSEEDEEEEEESEEEDKKKKSKKDDKKGKKKDKEEDDEEEEDSEEDKKKGKDKKEKDKEKGKDKDKNKEKDKKKGKDSEEEEEEDDDKDKDKDKKKEENEKDKKDEKKKEPEKKEEKKKSRTCTLL